MRCVIFGKQTIKGRKVLYTKQYLALRGYQETNKDYNFIYVIALPRALIVTPAVYAR